MFRRGAAFVSLFGARSLSRLQRHRLLRLPRHAEGHLRGRAGAGHGDLRVCCGGCDSGRECAGGRAGEKTERVKNLKRLFCGRLKSFVPSRRWTAHTHLYRRARERGAVCYPRGSRRGELPDPASASTQGPAVGLHVRGG